MVYRWTNQCYNAEMIGQTTNREYGQVMVLGGINGGRKMELVRVDGRLTVELDILTPYVLPICGIISVAYYINS